jgi:hypothetical protein
MVSLEFPVTGDNRAEVMTKILNWLAEGGN